MKTLIKKSTGEYVHIFETGKGNNEFFTNDELPKILSINCTFDLLKRVYPDLDFSDIKLIEIEVIRKDDKDVIQNNDLLGKFLLWHNEKYPEKNISNSEIGKFNLELNK